MKKLLLAFALASTSLVAREECPTPRFFAPDGSSCMIGSTECPSSPEMEAFLKDLRRQCREHLGAQNACALGIRINEDMQMEVLCGPTIDTL